MSYQLRNPAPSRSPEERAQIIADLGNHLEVEAMLRSIDQAAPPRPLQTGDRITTRFPGASIPAPLEITGITATHYTARPTIAQPCAMPHYRAGQVIRLPLDILARPTTFVIRRARP